MSIIFINPFMVRPSVPLSIRATANSSGTAVNMTITLPSGYVAGDLLMLFIALGSGTATVPSGWTSVRSATSGSTWHVMSKVATGSEGTSVVVTRSASATFTAISAAIIGADTATAVESPAATTATSTTPDPPAVSPSWGTTRNTLLIAYYGTASGTSPTVIPTGYSGLVYNGGNIPTSALSTKVAAVVTDNPSAYTKNVSSAWTSCTFAVKGLF